MPLSCHVLASGSKGNSILVCSARTRILLDAGLSGREVARRLEKTPVDGHQLDALVLSHEHTDHVRGAGIVSRRFGLPVYLSEGTLDALPPQVGRLPQTEVFRVGTAFFIGDLKLQPFSISHDAREPSGFVIENEGTRLGVCTDLGVATQLVKTRLQGCHGLVVEANHDLDRLINGPYPWHLKQRIRGRQGHLSNSDTCELLKTLFHECLRFVVFAHLSEVNNLPELVMDASSELTADPAWEKVRFEVGRQYEVTPPIDLD